MPSPASSTWQAPDGTIYITDAVNLMEVQWEEILKELSKR